MVVASVGEILWDVFPRGPRFGGAPANLACSLRGVSGEAVCVSMVSAVGSDELGERAIAELESRGVGVEFVQRSDRPTGTVDVSIDEHGVASYEFADDTAWDGLGWNDALETLAIKADAVCFGTLGQRSEPSRAAIQRFVALTPESTLRFLDVNLRPPFDERSVVLKSLELANFLKLSDDELAKLSTWCSLDGTEVERLRSLVDRFDLRGAALTRGSAGAVIVRGDEVSRHPGFAATVVDTVGAGDSFAATVVVGLLREWPLETVNRTACRVAAYVCSQEGATPRIPAELVASDA